MKKVLTFDELMFMEDRDVRGFLNQIITCTTKQDGKVVGRVINFEVAANDPNLICGFILDNGQRISYGAINNLEIEI